MHALSQAWPEVSLLTALSLSFHAQGSGLQPEHVLAFWRGMVEVLRVEPRASHRLDVECSVTQHRPQIRFSECLVSPPLRCSDLPVSCHLKKMQV